VSSSVASIEIREEDEDWYKFVNIICALHTFMVIREIVIN
jgi:hypothetical protein